MTQVKFNHQCTNCGKGIVRDQLIIKRSVFMTPGEGAKTIRSRVIAHLCPDCTAIDPEWNLPTRRVLEVTKHAT